MLTLLFLYCLLGFLTIMLVLAVGRIVPCAVRIDLWRRDELQLGKIV